MAAKVASPAKAALAVSIALALIASALSAATFFATRSELESLRASLSSLASELEKQESQRYPLQVVDTCGRLVVVPKKPERIVSLAPSTTELLFAVGAGNLVVGVDEFSNYPPEVVELVKSGRVKVVGGFANPNVELVASLNPDLVVGVSGVQAKFLEALSKRGIPTLCLDAESVEDVVKAAGLLGLVLGKQEEAAKVAVGIKEGLANVSSFVSEAASAERPKVLFVVWVEPIFAAGGASWVSSLVEVAGGVNALAELNASWPMLSWEAVLKANPDVIVLAEGAGGLKSAEEAVKWLLSQPGAANVSAVAKGRVYMVRGELNDAFSRPSPRVVLAAWALAYILHPEAFGAAEPGHDLRLQEVLEALEKRGLEVPTLLAEAAA